MLASLHTFFIMEKTNKLLKSKRVAFVLLPLFFLFVWFGLNVTFILNYDYSPSVISYVHSPTDSKIMPMTAQTKITGTFKSAHDYLGLIVLKFDKTKTTYDRFVIFRIKEQGSKGWLKQSVEKTNDFHFLHEFPLGFPVIKDSQGKTYVFEIELIHKTNFNSVGLLDDKNVLLSKYQFPKEKLINNRELMQSFILKKMSFLVNDTNYLFYSFLYLLPLVSYVLFLLFYDTYLHPLQQKYLDKHIQNYNYPVLFVTVVLIYTDIIFLPLRYTIVTIPLIGILFFCQYLYKLNSRVTYVVMISLLVIGFLAFITGISVVSEKAAAWICILLILALPQMIRETV